MKKGSASAYRIQDGFTIMELLIVIALIGIFTVLVLASLDKIREKQFEIKMEANFNTLKAQSERYYSRYNTFGINPQNPSYNICTAPKEYGFGSADGPGIFKTLANDTNAFPKTENETGGGWNIATCHAENDAWVVESPLQDSTSSLPHMYCEDSTGIFIQQNINISGNTYSCL